MDMTWCMESLIVCSFSSFAFPPLPSLAVYFSLSPPRSACFSFGDFAMHSSISLSFTLLIPIVHASHRVQEYLINYTVMNKWTYVGKKCDLSRKRQVDIASRCTYLQNVLGVITNREVKMQIRSEAGKCVFAWPWPMHTQCCMQTHSLRKRKDSRHYPHRWSM